MTPRSRCSSTWRTRPYTPDIADASSRRPRAVPIPSSTYSSPTGVLMLTSPTRRCQRYTLGRRRPEPNVRLVGSAPKQPQGLRPVHPHLGLATHPLHSCRRRFDQSACGSRRGRPMEFHPLEFAFQTVPGVAEYRRAGKVRRNHNEIRYGRPYEANLETCPRALSTVRPSSGANSAVRPRESKERLTAINLETARPEEGQAKALTSAERLNRFPRFRSQINGNFGLDDSSTYLIGHSSLNISLFPIPVQNGRPSKASDDHVFVAVAAGQQLRAEMRRDPLPFQFGDGPLRKIRPLAQQYGDRSTAVQHVETVPAKSRPANPPAARPAGGGSGQIQQHLVHLGFLKECQNISSKFWTDSRYRVTVVIPTR
ncbi:unnamed protein product, partial [Nesidiocoris tenuis]